MKKIVSLPLTLFTLALLMLGTVGLADHHMGEAETVVDVAVNTEGFSTLVAAIQQAGLDEDLSYAGPFTVFAPTDEAFAEALDALGMTAEELLASDMLETILLYHVVPGKLMAADVLAAIEEGGGLIAVETLSGERVSVNVSGGNVMLDATTQVLKTDIGAGNGVVHVIDSVLLPPFK